MKLIPVLLITLSLAACAGKPVRNLPTPPEPKQQVVVCNAETSKAPTDLDKAKTGLPLEEQNAILRTSLAQLKTYVIELEASFVQCGGKIKK